MTPNKKNLQPLVITNNEDIKYAIPQSAVFLDRDGVIIEEQPNYLRSKDAINYGKKLYKMVIKAKDELDDLI